MRHGEAPTYRTSAAAAAAGATGLALRRPPLVVIIPTGNEILAPTAIEPAGPESTQRVPSRSSDPGLHIAAVQEPGDRVCDGLAGL